MSTVRRRLIPVAALAVVLGLAVLWLLLARPATKPTGAGVSLPPQRASAIDRPRAAIGAGREFKLEELMGFDPSLAPWLSGSLERRTGEGARAPEQLASVSAGRKGR